MFKPKIRRLTKKSLLEYLESAPHKLHTCGDEHACVLANYFADTAEGFEQVEVNPNSLGGYVRFWQTKPNWKDELYPSQNPKAYTEELPKWANTLAVQFDALNDDLEYENKRVRSTTVLKKLRRYFS